MEVLLSCPAPLLSYSDNCLLKMKVKLYAKRIVVVKLNTTTNVFVI